MKDCLAIRSLPAAPEATTGSAQKTNGFKAPSRIYSEEDLESILFGKQSQSPFDERLTEVCVCAIDEGLAVHRGQGLDMVWRDSLQCPTEEQYVSMVNGSSVRSQFLSDAMLNRSPETSGGFRLIAKMLMACATTNTDL